jgi:hypothetical protein
MGKHSQPAIVPGDRRNHFTIIREDGFTIDGVKSRRRMLIAKCDCGQQVRIRSQRFFSGLIKSCGCVTSARRHGYKHHPLYACWLSMIRRCTKTSHRQYQNYGARGIRVCDRWLNSPGSFIEDMWPTYRPGLSIERIDNNGNYAPENCKWADNFEQQRNRRNNVYLVFRGERKTISEWSRVTGLHRASIKDRLDRGWSVDDALTKPRTNRYGNLK